MVVGYGVADVVLQKMDDRVAIYSMVVHMNMGDVSCQRACVHPLGKLSLPKPLVSLALPSYGHGFLGYEMIPRLLETNLRARAWYTHRELDLIFITPRVQHCVNAEAGIVSACMVNLLQNVLQMLIPCVHCRAAHASRLKPISPSVLPSRKKP